MSTSRTSEAGSVKQPKTDSLPTHLGFIVDGNRRWARARGLPTFKGHTEGFHKVEMAIDELQKRGLKFASFYLFSTENWGRSPEEVSYLMDLVKNNITDMIKKMKKQNIRTLIMGGQECPRPDIIKRLYAAADETASCTGMTVCICFNYGGQQEIVEAASAVLAERLAHAIFDSGDDLFTAYHFKPVTVADLEKHLYCPEVPPVDMIVRTSGEQRISGFQLWRAAYSEFYFIKDNFPDITPATIDEILTEYAHRQRRFGH